MKRASAGSSVAQRKHPSLLGAYAPLLAIAALGAVIIVLRNTGDGSTNP